MANTNFTVPEQARSAGETIFPSVNPPNSISHIDLGVVSATWATTPGLSMTIVLERSFDSGTTWQTWGGGTFSSGFGALPSLSSDFQNSAILRARARLILSAPISLGFSGSVS